MKLPRFHFFELEDQPWFPAVVREGMMDCLRFFFTRLGVYCSTAPVICHLLKQAKQIRVLDLCSGGGGGMGEVALLLRKNCHTEITVLLSDLYPNLPSFRFLEQNSNGVVTYSEVPVNALEVPQHLPKVRTLYTAFHHFTPDHAQALLQKAAEHKIYIGIFEGTSRKWVNLLLVLLLPLLVLLLTPFIRPFRWSRLLFTYLIPLIPLGVFWDGLVSMLRLYSISELQQMTDNATIPGYRWEVKEVKHWLGVKTVQVVGQPVD